MYTDIVGHSNQLHGFLLSSCQICPFSWFFFGLDSYSDISVITGAHFYLGGYFFSPLLDSSQ
jgi:hypothetical protein